MAEATRFKDILEAQKRMDQLLQTDSLKRDAVEAKFQEQIQGIDSKYDNLAKTLASIQLQLSNMDKGKSRVEEDSILGDPPPSYMDEGQYFKPPAQQLGRWNGQQQGNHLLCCGNTRIR